MSDGGGGPRQAGESYTQSYGAEVEQLSEALLEAAGGEKDWRSGLRAALDDLATFIEQQPELARAIFIEVFNGGEGALKMRRQVTARMAKAVDRARIEADAQVPAPEITAEFLVYAAESAVIRALEDDELTSFRAMQPDLIYLFVMPYFGSAAAREALRGWKSPERDSNS